MAESTGITETNRGLVAEYDTPDALIAAANRVREAGYTKTDAFSPFPVHGIDEAIGIKPTILPWIVLGAGVSGCLLGMGMEWWMNAVDYPYIISGKPYFSMPAFIPVSFELTILFASFAAFFGQWILNGLPRFSNPLFTSPKFDAATDDKFFLYIDARDPRFEPEGAKSLLSDTAPLSVDPVLEDDSRDSIPRPILLTVAILAVASLFPLLIIANMRVTKSGTPRFHIFWDMDFMPYKGPQEATTLFADGRTMRPRVRGTVSKGDLDLDLDFQTGIRIDELASVDPDRATRLVSHLLLSQQGGDDKPAEDKPAEDKPAEDKPADDKPADDKPADDKPADDKPADDKPADDKPADDKPADDKPAVENTPADGAPDTPPPAVDNTPWVTENPLGMTLQVIERGQERFQIYCAVCHGRDGFGNGLVNQRARRILAPTWVQPSSLHDERLHQKNMPDGKVFNTISNGIRKMSGYAGQISARDRWAIVAYLRVLQASRNATIDQIPAELQESLSQQAAAEKKALEEAEAERVKKQEQEKKEAEVTTAQATASGSGA